MTNNFAGNQNAQGVEIISLALNTASSDFDSSANSQQVRGWGFNITGVDSQPDRTTDLRNGFAHFSGFDPNLTTFQIPTNDRRRLVVLQGLAGGLDSSGNALPQWRVLHNARLPSFFEGDANDMAFRAAINSVFPAPALQTFAAWATDNNLPVGQNGAFNDADGDGVENILEFFFATIPTDRQSQGQLGFARAAGNGNYQITFRRAKGIENLGVELRSSEDLANWTLVPMTEANTTVIDQGTHEEVTVSVSSALANRFYRIEVSPAP